MQELIQNLLQINEKLASIVNENDLVGEIQGIQKEQNIQPTQILKKVFDEKIEQYRDLKIGILGRVKAGKSSFLNALIFKGQNVLPKAATPMTAALTILEYGDSFEAKVEFYTQSEIESMKNRHSAFLQALKTKENKKFEELKERNKSGKSETQLKESAKKFAKDELKNNDTAYAAYEQYEQIIASCIDIHSIKDSDIIKANSYDELNDKLKHYVGASGKYTPFTKSINLRLNEPMLENVKIIDTPGINDPVVSREERTMALIAECDVVFLLSPVGQFLSEQDLTLLNTINNKNGIKEFYAVASQFDIALFAPENISNGNLTQAIKKAQEPLKRQQNSIFNAKKDVYGDEICEKFLTSELLFNSGVSIEIINNYDNLKDENQKHIFGLLKINYPDFFDSKDVAMSSLKSIANLDNILNEIQKVRNKKDEIIKTIQQELLASKQQALNTYKSELEKLIHKKIEILKTADINELKAQIKQTQNIKSKVIVNTDESFNDSASILYNELKENLQNQINTLFADVSNEKDNSWGSQIITKTKTIDRGSGFLWWRDICGCRYDKKTYQQEQTTFNASKLRFALQNALMEINNILSSIYDENILQWKKTILQNLLHTLEKSVGYENLDADLIKQSVRNVVANISLPDFSIDTTLPASLQTSGTLVDSECDEFIHAFNDYNMSLKTRIYSQINEIASILKQSISNAQIGDKLINSYENQIQKLTQETQDKEHNIKRYECALEKIKQI